MAVRQSNGSQESTHRHTHNGVRERVNWRRRKKKKKKRREAKSRKWIKGGYDKLKREVWVVLICKSKRITKCMLQSRNGFLQRHEEALKL